MADVMRFVDLVRNRMLSDVQIIGAGFTKKSMYRQFLSQKKPDEITYPCMTICYDRDQREKWAAIDKLTLYISLHTKTFEDTVQAVEYVINLLHDFKDASTCVTVYHCWHEGGPPVPMYNKELNCWEATLGFSVSIG